MTPPVPVPFRMADDHGIREASGVLRLEGDFLVLRLQVATLELFKEDPKTIKLALHVLGEVEYVPRRLFRKARLVIRPSDLRVLDAVPFNKNGALTLLFKREHERVAAALADVLFYRMELYEPDEEA